MGKIKKNTCLTSCDLGSRTEYGKSILLDEASAISEAASILDDHFERAVTLINSLSKQGRVIVSGIGKAGIIANKISATFASTGTPSFFLHPAEAIHGDLGRFTEHDVALILSNSGQTEEVIKILPSIKRMGCPIISITADTNSSLAKNSDAAIAIGKQVETGPMGLAPTTSTTVMLAIGDALSMAVLQGKDFTREQFALYHPGGSLGRKLTKVSDIMRSGEELCIVSQTMQTKQVLHAISSTKGRPGAAAIIDSNGTLTGAFTDGDLRRHLEQEGSSFLDLPIVDVMGKNPKSITSDKLVEQALHALSTHKIDQLIVVTTENKPIGLIDIQDVIEFNV